jgi:hypothetical protein
MSMATARPLGHVHGCRAKITMTDDEVLEARALREFKGWPLKRLRDRYPHVDPRTLEHILDYTNRSRLIPNKSHVPENV